MLKSEINNDVPEVRAEDLKDFLGKIRLIDVRNPDEFTGELGHIEGSELVILGPDLRDFLEKEPRDESMVFVCRSGARSAQATMYSLQLGYQKVYNLKGGMLRWNELQYPVHR